MTDYTLLNNESMLRNERLFFRWLSVILGPREQKSWFDAGDPMFGLFRGKSNRCKRDTGKESRKREQLSGSPGKLPAKLGHVTAKVLPVTGKIETQPAKADAPTTNAEATTTDAEAQTAKAGSLTANAETPTTNAETNCGKA